MCTAPGKFYLHSVTDILSALSEGRTIVSSVQPSKVQIYAIERRTEFAHVRLPGFCLPVMGMPSVCAEPMMRSACDVLPCSGSGHTTGHASNRRSGRARFSESTYMPPTRAKRACPRLPKRSIALAWDQYAPESSTPACIPPRDTQSGAVPDLKLLAPWSIALLSAASGPMSGRGGFRECLLTPDCKP